MTDVTVKVEQGTLRGKTGVDYAGKLFYSFRSVPYARPPLGKLRFKDPQPPEAWEGVRDATKEGPVSYQWDIFNKEIVGSEDSLYLNVYTPRIERTKGELKPVMFWIHGGGYISGSGGSEQFGPEFLVANDVVLVTINYRLGLLGFLKLEDPALGVPGNAGLKDMVMALRWVEANVQSFQGDPDNVTIFGESAGSAAVQFLMLSPLTKGLFHKAVMQSGSVFSPWALGFPSKARLAGILKRDDEKEILDHLQGLPVEKVLEVQEEMKDDVQSAFNRRPFGPVVEKPSSGAFLSDEVFKLFQDGEYTKVPLIIGYNNAEGIINCLSVTKQEGFEPVHKDDTRLVPFGIGLEKFGADYKRVAQKVKEFYYKDIEPSLKTLDTYIQVESDIHFLHGVHKTVNSVAQTSQYPVYLYRFCFDGELNYMKKLLGISAKGASHCDELGYLFKNSQNPSPKPGSPEDATVRRLTKLWSNFAKCGDPNPKENDEDIEVTWKPVSSGAVNFLNIDENLSVGVNPEAERFAFWDGVYRDFSVTKY